MQFTKSEKKQGIIQPRQIGYWKGNLKWANPDSEAIKKIYDLSEDVEEVKYQGTDKNDKDWSLLKFVYEDELSKLPIEYRIFMSKDIAEFEVEQNGEKVMRTWYVNQWGESQLVYDKKDLFRSFTNIQVQNESKEWIDLLDENGKPVELSWRKAYKGETQLYSMLRKVANKGRYDWTINDSLFIPIDKIMRGSIKDITDYIGTENFQSVVGMIEIQAKDGDNGINYYQNCVDGAWMPGYRYAEANLTTSSNSWGKYEDKANGKGKNKDMYEFYHAVKRNKHITEFQPLHTFDPNSHLAAGNQTIAHSNEGGNQSVTDTDY